VERIRVGDLYNFARNARRDPKRYKVLPITEVRALAQSKNPAASPDDIGLLVAYSHGRCIGYLGILPCLFWNKGKISKIYALSTFFVDESFRGKSAASNIMANAIALNYDFLLADYTPSAEKFYRKNTRWFKFAGSLPYLIIHLIPHTSLLWWLQYRFKVTKRSIKPFYSINQRINEAGGWSFFFRFLHSSTYRRCGEIEVHPVSMVRNPEDEIDISSFKGEAFFYRDVNIVNWMIRYPWVTTDSVRSHNYIFSHYRDLHRFLPFELYERKDGKRIGYLVLLVTRKRDLRVLKILDHVLSNKAYLPCVLDIALNTAARWKAELVIGPNTLWPFVKSHTLLRLLTRHQKRGYFIHAASNNSLFPKDLSDLCFDFCDSDLPFT